MGKIQGKRLGQHRLSVGFDILQKGVNTFPVKTEATPPQDIPILGEDTLVEADGDCPGHDRPEYCAGRAIRRQNPGNQHIGVDDNPQPRSRRLRDAWISASISSIDSLSRPRAAASR